MHESVPDTMRRCATVTMEMPLVWESDKTKPEPTYFPLRSSLGHSIFTTDEKMASRSSGGKTGLGGATGAGAGEDEAVALSAVAEA